MGLRSFILRLSVRTLLLGAASTQFVYAAEGIHCEDFKKIYDFSVTEHLRFKTAGAHEALTVLKDSTEKIAQELSNQGYNFIGAQFSQDQNLIRRLKGLSSAFEICQALPSGLHRAMLLKTYVAALDPFSEFYMAEDLPRRTSVVDGRFVGLGIGTEKADPYIRVEEIVQGGPSDGILKLGDLISHVDGYPVRGLDASELRRRMRGEVGSKVVLRGKRVAEGQEQDLEVSVIRNHVYQQSVSHEWVDKQILQIKVHRFFAQTSSQVKELLNTNRKQLRGVILDLRDNPGGLLQAARDLVDLFVSKGVVIHLRGAYEDQMWAFESGGYTKLPLVVLVNERSASASEIVAGALQDYGRAVIVGTKTYGKSCIQNIYETKSGLGTDYEGGIKLTTLWYYLPSGRSVRVLQPDVLLASSLNQSVEHAKLPYDWPDQIEVVSPQFSLATNKKKFSKNFSEVITKDASPLDAGKALLKMMAQK